jgi:hypothetical protein
VVIPKGFPKGNRPYGLPPFPHSVISMACLKGADQRLKTGPMKVWAPESTPASVRFAATTATATCIRATHVLTLVTHSGPRPSLFVRPLPRFISIR